jgi:hypothetical protein
MPFVTLKITDMKKTILSFCAVAAFLIAGAQQTETLKDPNAEPRKISGFHAIQVEDGIDLYLSEAKEESLAVSGNGEHRNKIITVVENGVLRIYYDGEVLTGWRNRNLKAYIGFINLDKISASGGADIVVKGSIPGKSLTLRLSGGSDFLGKVNVTDLDVQQSGGSDVRISGTADNLRVNASGGSDFRGYELLSASADLHASGGSDAELTVTKELSARASGGSDVHYKGNAVIKHSSSGGGGSVSKRG